MTEVKTDKTGILFVNLGTPEAPTPKALRSYLGEFLADPRIVEAPRWLWRIILHGVILRIRPARSAKAYQGIWQEEGSPLLFHSQSLLHKLKQSYAEQGLNYEIELAMRYGKPSIEAALNRLLKKQVSKLVILPLYPQYSSTTTASTFDAVAKVLMKKRVLPHLTFIRDYYQHPAYIQAMAKQIKAYQAAQGTPDLLVFSYHGIPQKYVDKGDLYQAQCQATSALIAAELGIQNYRTTFQSRFGREPWLQPYTDQTMKSLVAEGVLSVQVVCPGFSADCLETIEEIEIENKGYFMENGGQQFGYIPCLNDEDIQVQALQALLIEYL